MRALVDQPRRFPADHVTLRQKFEGFVLDAQQRVFREEHFAFFVFGLKKVKWKNSRLIMKYNNVKKIQNGMIYSIIPSLLFKTL